jgi:hypothetical protein
MSRIHRLSIPVVLAALVAVLVGPSMATAATEITERVMIPASAFIPASDNYDYDNSGHTLQMNTGSGYFTAPLTLPAQKVRMKRIALYAYDNGAGNVCAHLYRAEPTVANETHQAGVCTSDNTDSPQKVDAGTSFPRFVNTGMQGPYLWVSVSDLALLHGVTVTYSYTP